MKRALHYSAFALSGAACGALGVFLSSAFIRNLSSAAGLVMRMIKPDAEIALKVTEVLSQLKGAHLLSPYPVIAIVFACLFLLFAHFGRKRRRIVRNAVIWLLMLIPAFLVSLVFTHVNDILFLDMIRLLISIVPNL